MVNRLITINHNNFRALYTQSRRLSYISNVGLKLEFAPIIAGHILIETYNLAITVYTFSIYLIQLESSFQLEILQFEECQLNLIATQASEYNQEEIEPNM